MIQRRHYSKSQRARGVTLVELTLTLAVTAILLSATVSVVLLASKAVPNAADASSSVMTASQVLNQIASELETATLVLEQTPTAITFLVPSRNGDPWPERIRYSWGGTSGMPLTRQYNLGTVVNLIDSVNQFSLTPVVSTNTESYPGVATEDASESLLIDYSAINVPGNLNINNTNWDGQVFANASWPAGVVGWRPTRVQFQAQSNGMFGVTIAQLRPVLSNLTPASSILGQVTILANGLSSSYSWCSLSFTGIDRFSTTASVCLMLQCSFGMPNSIVVERTNLSGLLQTSDAGSSWSYASNQAIASQLYGTLSHAGPAQYSVSTYDSAVGMSLRANASTNCAVTTTAQTLNHPEVLSSFWELKFNADPTSISSNADGTTDWSVHGGGTFNTSSLVNQTWIPGGVQLDSQPADNFARRTIIDLRLRATSVGSWAGMTINAARSGTTCAPVLAQISLQSDGTQTLTVWRKLNDFTTDVLLTIPGLPATPVDLHLIIDPTAGSVGICVNTVEYGSFAYKLYASSDTSKCLSLTSSGRAEFDYVRIREMQQ